MFKTNALFHHHPPIFIGEKEHYIDALRQKSKNQMEKISFKIKSEDYLKMLSDNGCSEKRVNRAKEEGREIPLSGRFGAPVMRDYSINGQTGKYPVLLVCDVQGNVLGYIAVSSLLQTKSTGTTFQINKADSPYKGLYGLNSERINKQLSGSEAVIVSNIVGKTYKAERPEVVVPKLQFDENDKCLHFKPTEEEALQQVETKKCIVITELV